MKYTDLAKRQAQHIIVFGDPKTGKSTLVSQLAEKGIGLIWISIDNGHVVIDKLSAAAQERIDIQVLPDTKEFPVAITTCLKLISGATIEVCNAHGQAACSVCKKEGASFSNYRFNSLHMDHVVVFDNISQLANSAMNFILQSTIDKSGKRVDPDTFKIGYDEFRLQGTLMDKFLTNIQQAKYHVICIAHVCETDMEDGKKKLVPLVGTVPFSRNVGKYFDHMVYCDVVNMKHAFGSATVYKSSVLTGSRSDVAIEKDEKASLYPFIAGYVQGQHAEENSNGADKATAILSGQNIVAAVAQPGPATSSSHDAGVPAAGNSVSNLNTTATTSAVVQHIRAVPDAVAAPSAVAPVPAEAGEQVSAAKEMLRKLRASRG